MGLPATATKTRVFIFPAPRWSRLHRPGQGDPRALAPASRGRGRSMLQAAAADAAAALATLEDPPATRHTASSFARRAARSSFASPVVARRSLERYLGNRERVDSRRSAAQPANGECSLGRTTRTSVTIRTAPVGSDFGVTLALEERDERLDRLTPEGARDLWTVSVGGEPTPSRVGARDRALRRSPNTSPSHGLYEKLGGPLSARQAAALLSLLVQLPADRQLSFSAGVRKRREG
jgi:hypothetical protein